MRVDGETKTRYELSNLKRLFRITPMNQEDITKALELIDQSSSFGILLPERPDFDTLAAAEALAQMLSGDQKVAGLLSPAALPGDTDKAAFPKLTGPAQLLKEFVISVDTSHTPVAQLRYEKPENRIDIILTPKLAPLGEDAISFHEGTIRCDCLVAVGVPDIERLANLADFAPDFFTENKIINIDTLEANTRYGEANCIDTGKVSRCELLAKLLAAQIMPATGQTAPLASHNSAAAGLLSPDIATLLLAGILSATRELASPNTPAETFAAVAKLMCLGGSHIGAQKLLYRQNRATPLSLMQLFARAAVRSKYDDDTNTLWSFLTSEDFAKTGRTPDDISAVLEYVSTGLTKNRITVLLWQDPGQMSGGQSQEHLRSPTAMRVLLSGDRAILDALANKEEHDQIDQGIRLQKTFQSFRDAEEYVHSLIRTAL
jgi:nanoRNase/pAp phosphatase (c-di-AMP/oligoRNAs hydrolase)